MRVPLRSFSFALAVVAPVSALAAEPIDPPAIDLPALEQAWHGCVREAYDRQPDRGAKAARGRGALDACKTHEDAYVAALMAARPDDRDGLVIGWAKTWAAYVAYVVDPVAAWIERLKR